MKTIYTLLTILTFSFFLVSCDDDETPAPNPNPVDNSGSGDGNGDGDNSNNTDTATVETQSKLFTSTNGSSDNVVVSFTINKDTGAVEQDETYSTGDYGDSAEGDFDGQSSIRVMGDYLLVVNAGENFGANGSISVFQIDATGTLTLVDQDSSANDTQNVDSGGIRPVSLDYWTNGTDTYVAVVNQHSNPLCATPDSTNSNTFSACVDQYGNALDASSNPRYTSSTARNLVLFSFDNGVLSPTGTVVEYTDPDWGGPSQVSFSNDGDLLAVTTWGVPHLAAFANENVQKSSRTYLYDVAVSTATGLAFNNERYYQQRGVSGSIGFSFSSDGQYIYVANFNIGTSVEDYSVTALKTDDSTVFSSNSSSVATANAAVPRVGAEACWSWITEDNSLLLIPSFSANSLSTYLVDGANLTHKETLDRKNQTAADTKDIFITNDSKFAYVLGGLNSHTIVTFDYDKDNQMLMEQTASPYQIPFSYPNNTNVSNSVHAYLGLAGWPEYYVGY